MSGRHSAVTGPATDQVPVMRGPGQSARTDIAVARVRRLVTAFTTELGHFPSCPQHSVLRGRAEQLDGAAARPVPDVVEIDRCWARLEDALVLFPAPGRGAAIGVDIAAAVSSMALAGVP